MTDWESDNYDGTIDCPHCGKSLGEAMYLFEDSNAVNTVETDCPHCGKDIKIRATISTDYYIAKGE